MLQYAPHACVCVCVHVYTALSSLTEGRIVQINTQYSSFSSYCYVCLCAFHVANVNSVFLYISPVF